MLTSDAELADVYWPLRISLMLCLVLELDFASADTSLIALTIDEKSCWELTVLLKLVETRNKSNEHKVRESEGELKWKQNALVQCRSRVC